ETSPKLLKKLLTGLWLCVAYSLRNINVVENSNWHPQEQAIVDAKTLVQFWWKIAYLQEGHHSLILFKSNNDLSLFLLYGQALDIIALGPLANNSLVRAQSTTQSYTYDFQPYTLQAVITCDAQSFNVLCSHHKLNLFHIYLDKILISEGETTQTIYEITEAVYELYSNVISHFSIWTHVYAGDEKPFAVVGSWD
ncbi:hypothetical protein ACJX0J_029796, partial [Zea mays]